MMTKIASAVTQKVLQKMTALEGVWPASQVRSQNVAADLAERSAPTHYPVVHVYCEKIVNDLREKFRSFSGTARMAVELRYSQDRLEGLEEVLEEGVDAAAGALQASKGDWGDGMFYAGAYEVGFGAVKRGGKNFIQVAKVTFEIGVSRN
jgi:hypothetical protein